jgi:hypothetical protein
MKGVNSMFKETWKSIKYNLEKIRVVYLQAGEKNPHLSEYESYDVCLNVLKHHKDKVICELEKLEDDLIEKRNEAMRKLK